jgi:hypothetical protein
VERGGRISRRRLARRDLTARRWPARPHLAHAAAARTAKRCGGPHGRAVRRRAPRRHREGESSSSSVSRSASSVRGRKRKRCQPPSRRLSLLPQEKGGRRGGFGCCTVFGAGIGGLLDFDFLFSPPIFRVGAGIGRLLELLSEAKKKKFYFERHNIKNKNPPRVRRYESLKTD